MAAQPPGPIGRDGEFQVRGSGPAQGHHKSVGLAPATMLLDKAEVSPVYLSPFPRQSARDGCCKALPERRLEYVALLVALLGAGPATRCA